MAGWVRGFVVVAFAVSAVSCRAGSAGRAFVQPEGLSYSVLSVAPGTTGVIGLGLLELADSGRTATIVSIAVDGDHVGAQAGRVLGVRIHRLTDSGGIGAMSESDLSGVDGNDGWHLEAPSGAVVAPGKPLGVAVLVRGQSLGTWSSDSLIIEYTIGGLRQTQHVSIGAALCVVSDPSTGAGCEA
jgi:hypothetical protein